MLRIVVGGIVAALAVNWISGLPSSAPTSQLARRISRLLDRAALTVEGTTAGKRRHLASIERVWSFRTARRCACSRARSAACSGSRSPTPQARSAPISARQR